MTADPGDLGDARTLQDPLAEALRIVDLADGAGLLVRLMGGMAIRAHAPDWPARTRRVEVDLDFATRGKDRGGFYELLAGEGYTADKRHNALFGGKQAYFVDVPRHRPVDVLVDSLEMCHRFEFKDRLAASSPTLPLAELLLSKLQVVKINRKDVLDALVLLAEHPLAQDDGAPDARTGQGAINVPRILSFTSNDWGWWRTVTGNLETLDKYLAVEQTPEYRMGIQPSSIPPMLGVSSAKARPLARIAVAKKLTVETKIGIPVSRTSAPSIETCTPQHMAHSSNWRSPVVKASSCAPVSK